MRKTSKVTSKIMLAVMIIATCLPLFFMSTSVFANYGSAQEAANDMLAKGWKGYAIWYADFGNYYECCTTGTTLYYKRSTRTICLPTNTGYYETNGTSNSYPVVPVSPGTNNSGGMQSSMAGNVSTSLKGSYTAIPGIVMTNCTVIDIDTGEIIIDNRPVTHEWDYYVTDNGNVFTDGQKADLMRLERKWEQNLNMQFFVVTSATDFPNEVQSLVNFGNSKGPTGNGSITVYISKRADGSYRMGFGMSIRAALSTPYSMEAHYQMFNRLKDAMAFYNGFSYGIFSDTWLQMEYNDMLNRPNQVENYVARTGVINALIYQNYFHWKMKRSLYDTDATLWALKNAPLPDYKNDDNWFQNSIYTPPEDSYWFMFEKYPTREWDTGLYPQFAADGHHVWFGELVTPGGIVEPPKGKPPEGKGGEPVVPEGVTPPEENPGNASNGGGIGGLFSGIWGLLGAIISLIIALLNAILRGLTFNVTLHDTGGSSSLLTPEMIQGLNFLKSYELPVFGMTIWGFFELVFTSVLIFALIKIINKIIRSVNGGG